MATQIKFTPVDESTEVTLDLTELAGGVKTFDGFRSHGKVARLFSKGGKAVTVVNEEPYFLYEISTPFFDRENSSASTYWFSILTAFLSHAERGGEFSFALDSGDTLNTTSSFNCTQGASGISVNSTATVEFADWLLLEDGADPTLWEAQKVSNVNPGSFTFNDTLSRGYPSGSVVRHLEYLPNCVFSSDAKLEERQAGNGIGWDLSIEIRTVR